jgi:hypothetical protein
MSWAPVKSCWVRVWAAIPSACRELGEDTVIWILSDQNTEAAAGGTQARLGGLRLTEEVLPSTPKPECTPQLVNARRPGEGGLRGSDHSGGQGK